MMRSRALAVCLLAASLWLAFSVPTYAYLDPGTGSYVLQLVLAAIVGLGFVIRLYWRKIKRFATKLFARNKPEAGQDQDAK